MDCQERELGQSLRKTNSHQRMQRKNLDTSFLISDKCFPSLEIGSEVRRASGHITIRKCRMGVTEAVGDGITPSCMRL